MRAYQIAARDQLELNELVGGLRTARDLETFIAAQASESVSVRAERIAVAHGTCRGD
jgi:hypothetical protein